jgi:hypothetical protein
MDTYLFGEAPTGSSSSLLDARFDPKVSAGGHYYKARLTTEPTHASNMYALFVCFPFA